MKGRRGFRLVDVDIVVGWDDPCLTAVAADLYPDAPAWRPGPGALHVTLALREGRFVAAIDGAPLPARSTLGELFQDAEWSIADAALGRLRHRYLPIHAAAVSLDGSALLLVGEPEAGKTSLAAALARSGADLLSDEVALVAPDGRTVHPFLRDLIVHAGTERGLGRLPPSPGYKCFPGYRHVPPSAIARRRVAPAPVAALVFPRRAADADVSQRALGPAEAARRVLRECFDLGGLGPRSVDCVARLAAQPAVELVFADAAPAAVRVRQWVRGLPRTSACAS